jgi:hypothetical protein
MRGIAMSGPSDGSIYAAVSRRSMPAAERRELDAEVDRRLGASLLVAYYRVSTRQQGESGSQEGQSAVRSASTWA